jgi:GT2 family glycosyltransferase
MIHVVTSVHNRYHITEKFIDGLLRQTCRELHLILIDDGSTDGTDQMVRAKMPLATILYGDGDLWWGGALQKAYEWLMAYGAEEDVVLITNDDTSYPSDYIETGVRLIAEHPGTLVVGSGYGMRSGQLLDGIFEHSFRDGTGHLLPPGSTGNCASTRSLFMTVGIWKKTGGMHPRLLPHYFSDFELTIRAGRKGFQICSYPELTFRFDEGATGDNEYETLTTKKLLGKRSGLNPIYRMNFILLTTPVKYLPEHLCHQVGRYGKKAGLLLRIIRKK